MTRTKHVLVLLLLILPMFALAPSMVAGPNEVLTNRAPAESMLPAQFVEETLRVAVYAEDNTSLPSYATGGVYTDNYANVISLLDSEGYDVTAMSTQDILDHKLVAANFDAFVLPDQLPKDEIIDLVKDYWLAGGGVLFFESSIGYAFYSGMIHSDYEGDFMLYPTNPSGRWAYLEYDGIHTTARHPITKSLQNDTEYPFTENATYLGGFELRPLLGSQYIELAIYEGNPDWSSMFALDNLNKGGKIVFLPGNCSSFETWMEPVIADAVDWLAPRPKAHIAIDYTHVPFYGVDSWDENVTNVPRYVEFRNFAVNHSFTFDKLYPKGSAELTAADLAPFDVIVLGIRGITGINYTTAEMEVIKAWVENGGGLFVLADWITEPSQQNLNELMSDWGLRVAIESATLGTTLSDSEANHPIFEGMNHLSFAGGKFLNITGDAYALANVSSDIALAGAEPGEGRVILAGDINFIQDAIIVEEDNIQFSINLFNWISSGPAKVLVYADSSGVSIHPNAVPLNGPVAQALNDLGIPFYMTSSVYYFNMSLFREDWDMVIYDNSNYNTDTYQPHLMDFVESGGKLIFTTWNMHSSIMPYFGIEDIDWLEVEPWELFLWNTAHPIFNLPADYDAASVDSNLDVFGGSGTYALNFTPFSNATTLAGFSAAPDGGAGILLCANGRAIINGPLLTLYNEDNDNSTYVDSVELWENQIAFLYFDRPTISHPADVTYMETETGNEISWTATADAGPWEYVLKENGTIIDEGHWAGGALTFNVDDVNASLTDYELTVFDTLGYSASDLVILNVTEYVATTTTTGGGVPLDPTLLLIIGVGAAVVIVIIIIVMKKKK